jgi:hypothetical protein
MLDTTAWSGEGEFTQVLIDRLQAIDGVIAIRVEDAPASRSDASYNFISNEIYLTFAQVVRDEPTRRFGFLPATRSVTVPALTIGGLEPVLTATAEVGAPDYADDGMLQYLRTERIIPPYQTRGYKLVELVRVYEVGTPSRA